MENGGVMQVEEGIEVEKEMEDEGEVMEGEGEVMEDEEEVVEVRGGKMDGVQVDNIESNTEDEDEEEAGDMEIYWEQQRQRVAARVREREMQRRNAMAFAQLEEHLQNWLRRCVVCAGAGLPDGHVITNCHRPEAARAVEEVKVRRVRVVIDRNTSCFKCGVPQSICKRWREDGSGGFVDVGGWCQFYGIMTSFVFAVRFGFRGVWERWLERLQELLIDGTNDGEVEAFLGLRIEAAGMQGCNMAREFCWLAERVGLGLQ